MNWYATLDELKRELGITSTSYDAHLGAVLEWASRHVDGLCGRHFYIEQGTRYFDTSDSSEHCWVDDCIDVTSLACDDDCDLSYGESWTEGEDFVLKPFNTWPKMEVWTHPDGNYSFAKLKRRYVKVVGAWGYGDGWRENPVDALGVNITASSSSATSVTASTAGVVQAGMTLLVENEQMFVSAVSDTSCTVVRGVNGTTAAAHNAKSASRYAYPMGVNRTAIVLASEAWNKRESAGKANEGLGDYRVTWMDDAQLDKRDMRLLGQYVRV